MTPDPLSGIQEALRLGNRQRVKRVSTEPLRPPREHRFCPLHPHRFLRGNERGPKEPCWECEMDGNSPLMDKAVFLELDFLIAMNVTCAQERIDPEILEAAKQMAEARIAK